jgi:nucleoside-diphosphate-sugar epimerase
MQNIRRPKSLVLGGSGFIGGHLIDFLQKKGHWVRSVDITSSKYDSCPDEFIKGDLRKADFVSEVISLDDSNSTLAFDFIYQLAADMGGAGFIFTGENDANIMHNSAVINLNLLDAFLTQSRKIDNLSTVLFYSSSACVYPEELQTEIMNSALKEEDAYPANPDSEYGWEKLFSERLFLAYARNHNFKVRIARFHNIFGPNGTWKGGREKSPAAISRKVALAKDGGSIEIWGDGKQTRSYLYIDECLEGIDKLMKSDISFPINLGSDYRISINELVQLVADIAGKRIHIQHDPGPLGVRGRCSDNSLIEYALGWRPTRPLNEGLRITYEWICEQIKKEF